MKKIDCKDISRLTALIDAAGQVVITSHVRADGDAIGCTAGLAAYLEVRGKNPVIVLQDALTENLKFVEEECVPEGRLLTFWASPDIAKERINAADLIFCMDCNSFSRTGDAENIFRASKAHKVLIDHHENPGGGDPEGTYDLIFSDTEVSSASEMAYHILMQMPDIQGDASKLPEASRFALMTGMTTDSNNFANSTYPSTLRMAASLVEAGTDRDRIVDNFTRMHRENRLRLFGALLKDRMEVTAENVALTILDAATAKAYDIHEGETEGFVNLPLTVKDIVMSVFIKEDNGQYRVSIRSKNGIRADLLASEFFHGGGHKPAAGGKVLIPEDVHGQEGVREYALNAIRSFFSTDSKR